MRWLLIVLLILSTTVDADSYEHYKHHTEYDGYFRKFSKHYFGVGFDWRHFKAQAIAESNLNPKAKSWVGAQGIMQIMPRTFDEIQRKNKWSQANAVEPRWNIAAGIWYNKRLFNYWDKGRDLSERLNFMYASYNAGKQNILKAQRVAINSGLNPRYWQSIASILDEVTGKNSKETVNYVEKITRIKKEIE
ncbi:MAG: transglycosylase SLT domain-containing protein [Kangiellaceae bacterium]|jgi:membrane-bound lytic murein transglycosylase F|nr:transglycosylase SLT domain-containing protein [Kangiellaceae bacterium]